VRAYIAAAAVMLSGILVMVGCAPQKPKELPPPPPPPPKVEVTLPDMTKAKDVEGVRRVAVSVTLEQQENGPRIGRGFSSAAGIVDLELARPLDEVLQIQVASAFKDLGLNVALAGVVRPTSGAVVRQEEARLHADYLAIPRLVVFLVSTGSGPNASSFGTAVMVVQVFGPGGGLVSEVPVRVSKAWTLKPANPGVVELRACVEEMLQEIKQKIVEDPALLEVLGLTKPEAAAPSAGTPAKP